MRFVVCCVLITLSFQAKCLEIEGEFLSVMRLTDSRYRNR